MPQNKLKENKAYIKFLARCTNSKLRKSVLASCPDKVIKSVCNAALNVAKGDVSLNSTQKKKLSQHRKQIDTLISKKDSITTKRKILQQEGRGLFALLPMILSTALSALGSRIAS